MTQSNVLPFEPPPAAARYPRAGFESIPRDLSKAELLRFFTSGIALGLIALSELLGKETVRRKFLAEAGGE